VARALLRRLLWLPCARRMASWGSAATPLRLAVGCVARVMQLVQQRRRGAAIRGGRCGEQQQCAATAAMRLRGICFCLASAGRRANRYMRMGHRVACWRLIVSESGMRITGREAFFAVRRDWMSRRLAPARPRPLPQAAPPFSVRSPARLCGWGARRTRVASAQAWEERRRGIVFHRLASGPFSRCCSAALARRSATRRHGDRLRALCGARGAGALRGLASCPVSQNGADALHTAAGAHARRLVLGPGR
jgi:hypothetical protein